MARLSIQLRDAEPAVFETTDALSIKVVAAAFPVTPALIGVHELATVLRNAGRGLWANRLDEYEEAHMVRLRIASSRLPSQVFS